MDETDLSRPKSVLEEFAVDGISIEEVQYSALREDLECDTRDFEAPTWSLAVDQQYLKNFSKEAIKRQDVIHELIQTEINHVRTLKLMLGVYLQELRESLLMDESQLERLFPRLDRLLHEHQNFLDRLKNRRREGLEAGSDQNYFISHIGDILLNQFSGELRSRLQDSYGIFCSRHTEAVNLYKDQLQSNKKFQNLMKRIGQLAIVRRLGVPEGILLVTQRITKYPVLVERLIKNTEAGSEEYKDLVLALERIKETISTVDTQVHQYEQLREIVAHIDPKSQGRTPSGKTFRREDLLQHDRKLLREGILTWRPQNRSKVLELVVILLPDLLLLLQEKDQKYVFASLEGKPAVLPLQKLIVREAAYSDRLMYLISASDKADMYEFQTSSSEERSSWRCQIWDAIESCPQVEEESSEPGEEIFTEKQRDSQDQLYMRDFLIEDLLRQKLQIVSDLSETQTDNSGTARRLLLRGSAAELQQGEQLINMAITHAESLQLQLMDVEMNSYPQPGEKDDETSSSNTRAVQSGDGFRSRNQRPNSDPHLRDLYLDNHELSADDEGDSFPPPPPPVHFSKAQQVDTGLKLIQILYSLKALVSQQDSELELLRVALSDRERTSRQRFSTIQDQERQRHMEKQREELLQLQKVHQQQRREQEEWAREQQRVLLQTDERMQEVSRREQECSRQMERLAAEREELSRNREEYQQDLERLRDSTRTVEREREKLEQLKKKYKKPNTITNPALASLLDTAQPPLLYSPVDDQSVAPKPHMTSLLQERPPVVPPRKESISMASSVKSYVPIQLVSTTNESLKSSMVQQQIPTKLAISKGKEKKSKSSHHRTNSAASIDVSEVFPIKMTANQGGSLRAQKSTSPARKLTPEIYIHPDPMMNSKPQPSVNAPRKISHSPSNQPSQTKSGNQDDIFFF